MLSVRGVKHWWIECPLRKCKVLVKYYLSGVAIVT